MRSITIKTRLSLLLFAILFSGLVITVTMFKNRIDIANLSNRTLHNILILEDVFDYNRMVGDNLFTIFTLRSYEPSAHLINIVRENRDDLHASLTEFVENEDRFEEFFSAGERQDIRNLLHLFEVTYVPMLNNILSLVEEERWDEAEFAFITNRSFYTTFGFIINSLFDTNLSYSDRRLTSMIDETRQGAYIMSSVVIGLILLLSVFGVKVVKSIIDPLSELGAAAEKVAGGELDVQFGRVQGNDEISALSIQVRDMLFKLNEAKTLELKTIELQSEREKAEAANAAKSGFLATVSHEIRTPMNAIIGEAQIQLQKENLPEDYASSIENIYSSGNELLGIINDLLDLSKIEAGKLELNILEYKTASFINDTIRLNSVRIGSKHIDLSVTLDETLPTLLYGDELRLKQILNNLLSNAIKYTDEGIVKFIVSHNREADMAHLKFIVTDTGRGMKPDELAQLFTEYLRFNNVTNRLTEGTGLGLSITKQLVEMMGGTISAESEFGKGSVFTVTIPQKILSTETIGHELAKQLQSFSYSSVRQSVKLQVVRTPMPYGKVLVVDDVHTNLVVAKGLLAPYGLIIETVGSGFKAVDRIKNGRTYDVIFMDHMMPEMDGIETTQKLRALGYSGIIVALTANALVGNSVMFAEHGFDDFIAKPIDIRQLNAVLNRFVRDRHPEEALLYPAGSIDSSIMNHTITNHTVIDHVGTNQTNESNDKSNEGSN